MDEHGFDCTVYKGGGGISLSPEQLKLYTNITGEKLESRLTVEKLAELITDNRELEQLRSKVAKLEKQIAKSHEHGWGNSPGWGRSKEVSEEWTI